MKKNKTIVGIAIAFSMLGCNNGNLEKTETSEKFLNESAEPISPSVPTEKNSNSSRQFIRTADLKFKVKNVFESTNAIEEITNKHGGFVTLTHLDSHVDYTSNTPVSEDSTLETKHISITNTITLRIPNTQLDTTLKEISKNIDYLDYRIIKADDVALQILSNKLTQNQSAKMEDRISKAIDKKGGKLGETTYAEETIITRNERADDALVSNLSLKDQIEFSTINLSIYERPTVRRELISNDKNIEAYEPGFGSRILESFAYGWNILENLVVLLAKFWGLILLGILLYFFVKKFGYKLKN